MNAASCRVLAMGIALERNSLASDAHSGSAQHGSIMDLNVSSSSPSIQWLAGSVGASGPSPFWSREAASDEVERSLAEIDDQTIFESVRNNCPRRRSSKALP
jgi:hypothetical protein